MCSPSAASCLDQHWQTLAAPAIQLVGGVAWGDSHHIAADFSTGPLHLAKASPILQHACVESVHSGCMPLSLLSFGPCMYAGFQLH